MNIIMKSALKKEDLEYRSSIKESNIEIQLMEDFINRDYDIDEKIELLKQLNFNVVAIHTPILNNYDIGLDSILVEEYREVFNKVCELANKLSNYCNHRIMVIVHIYSDIESLENNGRIKLINRELLFILECYKNVDIVLENVMPIEMRNGRVYSTNGFYDNNVKYCRQFIDKFGYKNRVGTVLDICHATITERLINHLRPEQNLSLEDYFYWNKEYIRLIHLSDTISTGYSKNEHGVGFREINKVLLDFLKLYTEYEYECPVTIEVQERNYCECVEYIRSKKLLLSLINDLKESKNGKYNIKEYRR